MVLKIKQRKSIPKKVLIYGLDGSGKSTYAEEYCKQHNLNAVCLDVDDTNFTSIPAVEFERSTHIKVKDQVLAFIRDVEKSDEFDTVIIDGVSSLLNLLVSNGKGINKYGDRTVALNKIINELARSHLNFILIGQIDLDTGTGEEVSVAVVNINSIVNEKYLCLYDGKQYTQETKKYRVATDYDKLEAEANIRQKPQKKSSDFQTANNYQNTETEIRKKAKGIITALELQNKDVTILNAKLQMMEYYKKGEIQDSECDKILKELEVLLNGTNRKTDS